MVDMKRPHDEMRSNARSVAAPAYVAVLTPPGEGGIAVMEVGGGGAANILDRLFRSPRDLRLADLPTGRLAYGQLIQKGEILDEVIVACVTTVAGEVFEVNCHGGAMASHRVMEALEAEGAHRLSPSERIKRLVQDHRLDAIGMEAAERIPAAPTLPAAAALLTQQRGALRRALDQIRADVESDPDWPVIEERVKELADTARFGCGLTEYARVVLAGRPNVGKSTLANALLRFDRMIVHHIPGTTRDTIDEVFSIDGMPFILIDTAGMREAENVIEQEGVRRGKAELSRADVAVLVFNAAEPLQPDDIRLLEGALPARPLIVANQCDRACPDTLSDIEQRAGRAPLQVSAIEERGIDTLEARILALAYPVRPADDAPLIFTRRQADHIRAVLAAVRAHDSARALACLSRLVLDPSVTR